jgi:hypothetical protein
MCNQLFPISKRVCHLAGWESSNSCSNRTRHRLHPESTVSPTLSAHCEVMSFCSIDSIPSVNYQPFPLILFWTKLFSGLQGCYIPQHEGKSEVLHSDSHFLFSGICGDCIFINLDRRLNYTFFSFSFSPISSKTTKKKKKKGFLD